MRYADSKATEASVRADFEREFTKAREFFERNAYQRVTPNFTLGSEAQWVVVGDTSPEFMNARDSDLKRVTQDIVSQIPRQNLDLFDYIFIVEASGTMYWAAMTRLRPTCTGQVQCTACTFRSDIDRFASAKNLY